MADEARQDQDRVAFVEVCRRVPLSAWPAQLLLRAGGGPTLHVTNSGIALVRADDHVALAAKPGMKNVAAEVSPHLRSGDVLEAEAGLFDRVACHWGRIADAHESRVHVLRQSALRDKPEDDRAIYLSDSLSPEVASVSLQSAWLRCTGAFASTKDFTRLLHQSRAVFYRSEKNAVSGFAVYTPLGHGHTLVGQICAQNPEGAARLFTGMTRAAHLTCNQQDQSWLIAAASPDDEAQLWRLRQRGLRPTKVRVKSGRLMD